MSCETAAARMRAQPFHLALGAVGLGVALEMAEQPVGHHLDQRWPLAAARAGHGFAGGGEHRHRVVVFHQHAGHAVTGRAHVVEGHGGGIGLGPIMSMGPQIVVLR